MPPNHLHTKQKNEYKRGEKLFPFSKAMVLLPLVSCAFFFSFNDVNDVAKVSNDENDRKQDHTFMPQRKPNRNNI